MSIFVDCDVLLDVGLERKPFVDVSAALLDYLETNPYSASIAWHSVSNIYYIASKAKSSEQARGFIADLCSFLSIVPTSNQHVKTALELPMKDFEDALQCAAALACDAQWIVTRNVDDYANAPIVAIKPDNLLQNLHTRTS